MKLSSVLQLLAAATMKAFLALTFLAALSLAAGVDLKSLKPLGIVLPVNPRHTAQEWQDIYAARNPSTEYNPNHKKGTEPQPVFASKVHVPLNEQANRITNGYTATRGQFPWQVALIINGMSFCGGSLISSLWVMTAAYCAGSTYTVVLGANRYDGTESGALILTSRTSIVHEAYNHSTFNNDIAVVQLPSAVGFTTYISPIRLRNIAGDLAGVTARVSGWGRTANTSDLSPTLNYVDLTVITNTQCATTFGSIITSTKICCSTPGGRSPCNGDSGSPLVFLESDGHYTEIGIVSFGYYDCTDGYPAAFTRVTSYLSWISSNTGIITG